MRVVIRLQASSSSTHSFWWTRLITRTPDCSMPETGEVKEVHSHGRAVTFEWRVRDFFQLKDRCYYHSPSAEYFNSEWGLRIYKTGNGIDHVCLTRNRSTPDTPEPVHFGIRCNSFDGEERGAVREQMYPEQGWWVLRIDPRWTIPSSAGLTLTCTLRKGDSLHATDISILREHWTKLLLSGTGHDVLIRVGDKQFRAHKHILEARSPVFAAMFGSDMAESAGNSVAIEDCDPDSFGQFLQFVYCGRADIASVGGALGLYYAGDKYDFPTLKEMCAEFLKSSFSTTTVFEVVSLAARHDEKELFRLAIAYFAENLEEVWRTVEWQRYLSANPIEANEMNLKALKGKSSVHKKRKRRLSPDRGMGRV